jgi:integrase
MSLSYIVRERGNSIAIVFRHKGKQVTRAVKVADVKAAHRLAPTLIEAYVAEYYRGIANPLVAAPKKKKSELTISKLLSAYTIANKRCNGATETANRQAFMRLARAISGLDVRETGKLGVGVITAKAVRKWQASKQGVEGDLPDLNARLSVNVTLNSTLVMASCVINGGLNYPFEIPDSLVEALNVPRLAIPRQGWNPWPIESYRAMAEAGDDLSGELWLCHQLLRRLGLRASEAKAAQASWIRPMSGGRLGLAVQDYPSQLPHPFAIKGASARVLAIPDDLLKAVQYRAAKGGYLLQGERKFTISRGKVQIDMPLVDEEHIQFLRKFCPEDTQKPGHELRKWVGAIIFSTKGAEAARAFLGHSDLTVLLRHYSSYLASVDVDDLLKTIE